MTERTSKAVKQAIGIPTAILVVIYVANWAVDKFAGSQFVPRAEYNADQLRRAQFDSSQAATLRRIDGRIADIYCGQLPPPLRPGCR